MKPRFTDLDRYKYGYTPADETDIRKTFARVRAEQQKNREEAQVKVAPLKRAAK